MSRKKFLFILAMTLCVLISWNDQRALQRQFNAEFENTGEVVMRDTTLNRITLTRWSGVVFIVAQFSLIISAMRHVRRQSLPGHRVIFWDLVILCVPLIGCLFALSIFPHHEK